MEPYSGDSWLLGQKGMDTGACLCPDHVCRKYRTALSGRQEPGINVTTLGLYSGPGSFVHGGPASMMGTDCCAGSSARIFSPCT